ncbi:MAG: DUF5689 domain-containing protein [Chitinophagales bacterium]|nr:DUF5689 domain-containing protein [Chitinophagales bacterium]
MKTLYQKSWLAIVVLITIFNLSGCLKDDFDTPPTNIPEIKDEQILTFDQMFEKLVTGKITNIQEDKYLEALVVADDQSGNIFKVLILKDMRGEKGISMSIDENELHALYPVGQVVYVHVKDLAIGYYEGLPTLGVNSGSTVGRIPASLIRSILIKSGRTAAVEPLKVKYSELNSTHHNRLIQLEGMQFETATSSTTYADANPADPQSINHNLIDCDNNKIILRNSGFASFAGQTVPQGNGSIVAVYSYFRNAAQLLIRDVTDVNFTGERCDGSGGSSGERISVKDLRAKYAGTDVKIGSGYVQGIVISDVVNKNLNNQNLVLQDGDYGILMRFTSAINVPLNTEIKINLKGGLLAPYNGLLQVQDLSNQGVEVIASDKPVTPKVLTIAQIDLNQHESTLVQIQNATLIGGNKFEETTIKIKDGSGEVQFFTNKAATFATQSIPSGTIAVTAIVSNFNGKQLSIRNLSDITGGTPCDLNDANADCDGDGVANGQDCAPENPLIYPGAPCNDGDPNTFGDQYDEQCICKGTPGGAGGINENFDGQTADQDISIAGWDNVNVKGNRKWLAKYFSNEKNYYAQATAFGNTGPAEMEAWLISPVIDTDKASEFSLRTSFQSWVHDGLSIWVTTNYTGDPNTTVWQEVSGLRIATQGDTNQSWIPSGTVDLKQYGKNLRIGFKHVGSQAKNTTSYRIDDIKVE